MLKKIILISALSASFAVSFGDSRTGLATDNATIKSTGYRTGASGQKYFDVEGTGNSTFADYGVVDFNPADFNFGGPVLAQTLSLTLTQQNASFTHGGQVELWLATADLSTAIRSISPALVFGDNGAPLVPVDLGAGSFAQVANGHKDTYSFTLSGAAQADLSAVLNGGQTVRLVITPTDAKVAATWAGFSYTPTATNAPSLTITANAVPEPASLAALAIGVVALLRRRK